MTVFKRNNESDVTASHYLTNTICVNCQRDAWTYFEPVSDEWENQCEGSKCTGPSNYMIDDQDGNFTGRISQIIANNSNIGDNENLCQKIDGINGHWCNTSSFAVL